MGQPIAGGGASPPSLSSHSSFGGASKKERRQLRREERRREQEKITKAKWRKNALIWIAVILAVAAVGFGIFKLLTLSSKDVVADISKACVTHSGGMHIHPRLRIVITGEDQQIPANIGVLATCMRPLHTHDASGTLHVEFPRPHNFTLGDFFSIWEKPFSNAEILGHKADETHEITFLVNGAPNSEYEKYIVKDRDQIEIRYDEKK